MQPESISEEDESPGCAIMNEPLVSVIIPTFNCGRYVEDAIESVLNQTFRRFEIIVVDDGSTDDTGSKLKKYKDRVQVVTQENQGSSKARNVGLELSRGDYVAFLDADDRWLPEKLERQLACFRELGDVGMVFTDFSAIDPDGGIVATSYLEGAFGVFREYGIALPDIFRDSRRIPGTGPASDPVALRAHFGPVFRELCKGNFILPSTTLFRRSHIERIGLRFNETYRCAIDQDFHLRFALHHPVAYLDAVTAEYRIGREGKLSGNPNTPRLILNTIETLENIFRERENLRTEHSALFQMVMARSHARLAYYYLSVLDRMNARKHAHASLSYEPPLLKAVWILLASFTPLFVLEVLGRLKRLLR
jgi:glycosyltransferase involved in cell wall biosynthesis